MTNLYHITHVDNLESIIRYGGILSDNAMNAKNITHVGIAHTNIKDRRAQKTVPLYPEGTLADYVPFYFAPRSPMLYAIHHGNVRGYAEGQAEVLYIVTTVEVVRLQDIPFVFTDGHAVMAISMFYSDVVYLDKIDWEIMRAVYWKDNVQDNDRERRRQAEFLIHQSFPVGLIKAIGVMNDTIAERVNNIIASVERPPDVIIRRKWYC